MTKWVNKELLDRRVILQQAASREHLPEYAVKDIPGEGFSVE